MKTKVITYTMNPALDLHAATDEIVPDIKIRCERPDREPGGGGVNVSRALKRLGCKSLAVYTKGGAIGDLYEQLVRNEGLEQYALPTEAITRENLSVQEKDSMNMYRFVLPGSDLQEKDWRKLLDKVEEFSDAEYLVASGSLPPGVPDDFYALLSEQARKYNIKFILDTSKKPLVEILKSGAFLIKPNEKELEQLTGKRAETEDDQLRAVEEIVSNYDIEVVVVSLGPKGAIIATREMLKKLASPQIEKKESAIGAGDSMVAGIVYSLNEGNDIQTAVKYGLACGSAALMTPGTELVYKEDADRLFEQFLKLAAQ